MGAAERMQSLKEKVERQTRGQSWTPRRSSSAVVHGIAADIRALKNDPSGLEEYAGMLEANHAVLADLGTLNPDLDARRAEAERVEAKAETDRQAALRKVGDEKVAADRAEAERKADAERKAKASPSQT